MKFLSTKQQTLNNFKTQNSNVSNSEHSNFVNYLEFRDLNFGFTPERSW